MPDRSAAPPGSRLGRWLDQVRDRGVQYPWSGLVSSPTNQTATTDRDGRFRLTGVGPDQLAEIFVSGPTIATAELYAMSRDGDEVRAALHGFRGATPIIYHTRRFEYAAAPGKPIEGLVRDRDSGRPIAGVTLRAAVFEDSSLIPAPGIEATTDAQGHYRLTGLPRAPAYRLFIHPGEGTPYPNATLRVEGDTPGFDPVKHDVALKRGVLLRGKVTDKATGRPVGGYVSVYTFADNPHVDEFPGYRSSYPPQAPIKDGQYEVVALPGRSVLGCRAADMNLYRGYVGAEAIKGYDPKIPGFHTRPHYCNVWNYNAVAELNLDPKAETATLDIQVDPGRTIVVNPVDPDGKPVAGTMAAGLGDLFSSTEYPQSSTKVEIHALDPSRPRRVIVRHPGRKLIGTVYLKGAEAGPITLQLQPYGTIAGRVVDDEGRPMGGVRLTSAGGSYPKRPAEQGILPGGNMGIGILIGKDGRFRVEGLVPGLEYGGSGFDGKMTGGELFRDVAVAPGEVKDLGDLKLIAPK